MTYDVIVIGGGPAGLAAAQSAREKGASVCIIEREGRLGGILKQCIHDGFGLIRFKEKLSGPEYAFRYADEVRRMNIPCLMWTFVTDIASEGDGRGFLVTAVNREGVQKIRSKALVLATGCRERTSKQVAIHGTRPAGIFSAGTAQHFTNIQGLMPTKKCVILGSGDIGLIMARRLTLEGAEVVGVFEVKSEPSGLSRNIVQCLDDFGIPLYLSETVTKVYGDERLTAVEVCKVDEKMQPVFETRRKIECDALILSVGLIPENEMAEKLSVQTDPVTRGPVCDSSMMTSVPGAFTCGNAWHVNDLVDYVSESGHLAGKKAVFYALKKNAKSEEQYDENREQHDENREQSENHPPVHVCASGETAYVVPQLIRPEDARGPVVFYFRVKKTMGKSRLTVRRGNDVLLERTYSGLRPPEMERIALVPGEGEMALTFEVKEVDA